MSERRGGTLIYLNKGRVMALIQCKPLFNYWLHTIRSILDLFDDVDGALDMFVSLLENVLNKYSICSI